MVCMCVGVCVCACACACVCVYVCVCVCVCVCVWKGMLDMKFYGLSVYTSAFPLLRGKSVLVFGTLPLIKYLWNVQGHPCSYMHVTGLNRRLEGPNDWGYRVWVSARSTGYGYQPGVLDMGISQEYWVWVPARSTGYGYRSSHLLADPFLGSVKCVDMHVSNDLLSSDYHSTEVGSKL